MKSYDELLSLIVDRREQVERFEQYLKMTDWRHAPASGKHHNNYAGGLVQHSVNVTNNLLTLKNALYPVLSDESCVIVGLYHDAGKAGLPDMPYYIPQTNDWRVRNLNEKYINNNKFLHIDVPTVSLYSLLPYVTLYPEEVQAIRYHDGAYDPINESVKLKECPLTLMVHWADMWASQVMEKK